MKKYEVDNSGELFATFFLIIVFASLFQWVGSSEININSGIVGLALFFTVFRLKFREVNE